MEKAIYKPVSLTAETRAKVEEMARREGRSFAKQAEVLLESGLRVFEERERSRRGKTQIDMAVLEARR
jgi:hypothetical protein